MTCFKNTVVLGATSGLAEAFVRRLAAHPEARRIVLVARSAEKLAVVADDLRVRSDDRVTVLKLTGDCRDEGFQSEMIRSAADFCAEGIDGVLVTHGFLPESEAGATDPVVLTDSINVNFTSTARITAQLAPVLARRESRTWLAVVSSVAGDRGRAANPGYGAAKAGLQAWLSGLRGRHWKTGLRIIDIRPGFVDTPMTAEMDKGPLFASPDRVATDIEKAIRKRKSICYTPWFWWPIMTAIKALPESLFQRLKL
ncbi:MAG: SDR family NAD(P)-dependent oxidoreductase [Opitutales bacterium]